MMVELSNAGGWLGSIEADAALTEGPSALPEIRPPRASISGSISRSLSIKEGFGTYIAAIPADAPKGAAPVRSFQPSGSDSWVLAHMPTGRYRIVTARSDVSPGHGLEETDLTESAFVTVEEAQAVTRVELEIRDR